MKTLILTDAQLATLVSVLQADIKETEQMIYDYNGSLSNIVSKEELQDVLAQSEEILKLVEKA